MRQSHANTVATLLGQAMRHADECEVAGIEQAVGHVRSYMIERYTLEFDPARFDEFYQRAVDGHAFETDPEREEPRTGPNGQRLRPRVPPPPPGRIDKALHAVVRHCRKVIKRRERRAIARTNASRAKAVRG